MNLFSYDEDEFGNLDFTDPPPRRYADEKRYNTKATSTYSKRPQSTQRRKRPRKDPIRTTLDHFSYLDKYRDKERYRKKENSDVVYSFEYPKQTSTTTGYRTPIEQGTLYKKGFFQHPTGYISNSQMKNIQKSAGKMCICNISLTILYTNVYEKSIPSPLKYFCR